MRGNRILAACTALVMAAGLATSAAGASAVTYHGTFSHGQAFWSTGPAGAVLEMPVAGDWNLNVNLMLADGGRARAVMVVRYVDGGLHALWRPSEMELQPVTAESPASAVIPDLAGVVNDPAHGVYAYQAHVAYMDTTFFVVYDVNAERFFYAGVPGTGFACPPPSAEVPFCFDSVQVIGTGGR